MERGEWIESVGNSAARPADLALLFVVAIRANADGECRIKQTELSAWLNVNRRAIRRSVSRLVAAGDLAVVRGVGRRPTEFRLLTQRTQRTGGGMESGHGRTLRAVTGAPSERSRAHPLGEGAPVSAPTTGIGGEPTHTTGRPRADTGAPSSAQPVTGYMVKEPVVSQNQAGVSVSDSPRLFCADILGLHPKTAAVVCRKLAHYTDREALGRLKLWRLYAIVQVQRGKVTRSTSGYVAAAIRRGWSLPDWFADEIGKAEDPAIRELGRYL